MSKYKTYSEDKPECHYCHLELNQTETETLREGAFGDLFCEAESCVYDYINEHDFINEHDLCESEVK